MHSTLLMELIFFYFLKLYPLFLLNKEVVCQKKSIIGTIGSVRKIHCFKKQEIPSNLHKLLPRSTWRADCEEWQHCRVRICSMFFTALFNNSQTAKVRVQPDYLSWCCYRGFYHSSSARSCHASGERQQLITWQILLCYDANKIGSLNLWKMRTVPTLKPAHLGGVDSGCFTAFSARNTNVHL